MHKHEFAPDCLHLLAVLSARYDHLPHIVRIADTVLKIIRGLHIKVNCHFLNRWSDI